MDIFVQELIMKHLRNNKIIDYIGHLMFSQMCEACYDNYYITGMNEDDAVKDAVGIVMLCHNMKIPGYKIWIA